MNGPYSLIPAVGCTVRLGGPKYVTVPGRPGYLHAHFIYQCIGNANLRRPLTLLHRPLHAYVTVQLLISLATSTAVTTLLWTTLHSSLRLTNYTGYALFCKPPQYRSRLNTLELSSETWNTMMSNAWLMIMNISTLRQAKPCHPKITRLPLPALAGRCGNTQLTSNSPNSSL
eukprot:SAG11_NODE_8044_length_1065_cov_1.699793_1_plen_172_part_00